MMGFVRKCLSSCENVFVYTAMGSTFVMMCLTTADAVGRYLFKWPIPVAYEITERYLMPITLSLGLSYAYRGGSFIRVTFLVDRLPTLVKLIVNNLVQVITTLYATALVLATLRRTLQMMETGGTLANIKLQLWHAYLMGPVGLFVLTLLMVFDLREVKSGKSHLFQEGSLTS